MVHADTPGSLSDKDLAQRATLSGWRKTLHAHSSALGCATGLLFGILVIAVHLFVVSMNIIGMLFFLFAGGLFGSLGVMSALQSLATLGKGRYSRELRRRYGLLPFETYLRNEKAIPGVRLSLLAKGVGLPSGGPRFFRIRYRQEGTVEADACAARHADIDWTGGTIPHALVSRTHTVLEETEAVRIERLTEALSFGTRETYNADLIDGFPCHLAVIRHHQGASYQLECNLAGLPEGEGLPPGVTLLQAVMNVARKLNPTTECIGSCNAGGAITIERRTP